MGTIRVMFMYLCSIIYVQLISPILGKHKCAWEPLELCLCIYVQLIIPAVFELTFPLCLRNKKSFVSQEQKALCVRNKKRFVSQEQKASVSYTHLRAHETLR